MALFAIAESRTARVFLLVAAFLFLFSALFITGPAQAEQSKKPKLNKYYANWLDRDAVYIITRQERKEFLALTTDAERDNFIQRFWDIRNPTPGSPENTYKDEIYERIEYADAHFGIGSGGEGWRTDRGRTYIELGPPQQVQKYPGPANLRPMEIWFYSNLNPSLPPFFYILFYQRDNVGDLRYYSPSMDGPDALVSGMEAINDPQSALKIINSSVGPEVTRVTQSLIPGEPLDPNGHVSLQSDVMLSIIRNLANQPFNVDELNRRRATTESVVSRMILDLQNLDIVLLPVRDPRGLSRLDYALRLASPSDLSVAKDSQGRYSYAVEIRVGVFTHDNKLIFTQQKSVSGNLNDQQLDEIKRRPFGYEGILPLPPGKYHLDFLVTDWTKRVGLHATRDVAIPENSASTFTIPGILPFSTADTADPTKQAVTPFAMGGLRFTPLEGSRLFFNSIQDLKVTYQIWAPPKSPPDEEGQNLQVQYALGEPALAGTATMFKDNVDMTQFAATGSLVNGKKIPLADKPAGNYMLTISVNGPKGEKTFSSLAFQILNDVPTVSPWDVDEPGIDTDEAKGILDQQRALSYLAAGNITEARRWFRVALNKDHNDDVARAHLVEAYYSANAYSAVVSLLNDAGVTSGTDSGTIVQIAESLLKTGNTPKAMALLKDVIQTRPEDGPLYLALADGYQQMGDSRNAEEMSRKGKSLMANDSNPK